MRKRIAKKIVKQLASDFKGPKYQKHQSLKAYHKLGVEYCLKNYQIEFVTLVNTIVRYKNGVRVEERMKNPFLYVTMTPIAMYDEMVEIQLDAILKSSDSQV